MKERLPLLVFLAVLVLAPPLSVTVSVRLKVVGALKVRLKLDAVETVLPFCSFHA